MEIAQTIKQWRKENKITQEQVAEALGIKRPNFARLETGKYGFKAEHIKKIAETFHVSADTLLGIDKTGWEESEKG